MGDVAENAPTSARAERGQARRHAFLTAAREVFLEQGFEAANVNDVVRRAGGSLSTLYAQFGNKEGLFLAVAQERHEAMMKALIPDSVSHLPLRSGLQVIGEHYLTASLKPDMVAFFRIIVGEGRRFPDLMRNYLAAAADSVRAAVAGYITQAAGSAEGAGPAAAYFLDMLRGRHAYRALADENYQLTGDQLSAHVAQVVQFTLRGMGRS